MPSPPDAGVSPSLATGFADPDASPGYLMWRVTNRWQAAQRAALKPLGLTHVQFVLLASLTWLDEDGQVNQRRLADHACTDPMMTSQVLRVLEQRKLVVRAPHPRDARARMLSVTAHGRELANRAVVIVEDCDRKFFAELAKRLKPFTEDLAVLAAASIKDPATRPTSR